MIQNVQCPQCGATNTNTARFCAKCGRVLTSSSPAPSAGASVTCPQCRASLAAGAHFCSNCGYNFAAAQQAPAAASAAPVGPTPPQQAAPPPGGQGAMGPHATRLVSAPGAMPTLIIRYAGGVLQRAVLTKPVSKVGRAPDNDVVINHPSVSGHHLMLELQAGQLLVTDLKSTNGTLLNNQMIPASQPQPFEVTDVLRIGDLTGNSVAISQESELGQSIRTLSLGQLDLTSVPNMVIGRDPACYLPLNHPTVSSHHAMIFKQDGGLAIRDMGSTNGTFVNGKRIAQVPLKSGDTIQIGPFRLVYDAQAQSLAQSLIKGHRLDAMQLSRVVGDGVWILKDVTLCVQPGDFIALVGGSGAGKSTLMKAMNGYERATHGRMLIDGGDLYPQLDLYRTQMGYVPQDDIIHRELPVRLALWYAAKLRLPNLSPADIDVRIDNVLKSVEMVEHQQKRVSKLSGGQRKRVSIAVELLASPTLFFLDEPTSGLDPGLEKKMMYDLNRLADEGRTVVLVTHATANIEQCDYVAFMTKGRLSYYGPPKEALNFFQVQDFSDIYQELAVEIDPNKGKPAPQKLAPYYQQYIQQVASQPVPVNAKKGTGPTSKVTSGVLWAEAFRNSPFYQKHIADRQGQLPAGGGQMGPQSAPVSRPPRDSFFRQSWILARRQFDLVRMDMRTLFILLLMMPFIALMFMLVSKPGALVGRGSQSIANVEQELREEALEEYDKYSGADEYDVADPERDWSAEYKPYPDAKTLLIMLGLALTQAGTFGAAYEIVKERAIFKRERAVNLKVTAYVLSKVVVLALFALVQVASVILIIGLRIKLNYESVFFPDLKFGSLFELFLIMYFGVLASIGFGLLISAIVPSMDVVLYAILAQLFVQIVLSATLFPLPANPLSYLTPGYWTMNALGSSVDLKTLDDEAIKCMITPEMLQQLPPGADVSVDMITCPSATAREANIENYKHEPEHLQIALGAMFGLFIFYVGLTILVQTRKKID